MKTLEFRNMDIVVKPIEEFMMLYPSKVKAVINTSGSPSAWTDYDWSTIWTPGKGREALRKAILDFQKEVEDEDTRTDEACEMGNQWNYEAGLRFYF